MQESGALECGPESSDLCIGRNEPSEPVISDAHRRDDGSLAAEFETRFSKHSQLLHRLRTVQVRVRRGEHV
jgi:hypothetical protein